MIGKEKYVLLPSMFVDPKWGIEFEDDCLIMGYVHMFPHAFRNDADGNPLTCHIDMMLRFHKEDNTFKKVYKYINIG